MKKLILFLILSIPTCLLHAQQPLIKFYQYDGSTKHYNIEDIDNLRFITSNLSYQMQIFNKDSGVTIKYDIREIYSIRFENMKMKVAFASQIIEQELADIDSIIFVWNTCEEIQIGNQIWMCKNLDVDHYRNGDPIPEVRDSIEWINLTTGAWCYYNNDSTLGTVYGKLYNWYAVNDTRGLAPEGWHVASDYEWSKLITYLGGGDIAGGKLKSTGTIEIGNGLWYEPNLGATNESGFSSLPGSSRGWFGVFEFKIGYGAHWWSSTQDDSTEAWIRYQSYKQTNIFRNPAWKKSGRSVRCIKD